MFDLELLLDWTLKMLSLTSKEHAQFFLRSQNRSQETGLKQWHKYKYSFAFRTAKIYESMFWEVIISKTKKNILDFFRTHTKKDWDWLVSEHTVYFTDLGKLNLLAVVQFLVQANFLYCPQKRRLASKVVKIALKIIISLTRSKYLKHTVYFYAWYTTKFILDCRFNG